MSGALADLAGEEVLLLPEHALYWPRAAALIVADLHWGKAATFRAAGIPIPPGGTGEDLARLDRALLRTGARRLIVLGDLFHARAGRAALETLAELGRWRLARTDLEILLVRGNHDRRAGDPPPGLAIECADAPAELPPFVLHHHPTESRTGYVLAGHLHPGVTLVGPAHLRERLPCFVVRPKMTILPAFGGFTGHGTVDPEPGDRLFAIVDQDILQLDPALVRGAAL